MFLFFIMTDFAIVGTFQVFGFLSIENILQNVFVFG